MDIARLTAKQKRLKDWLLAAEEECQDARLQRDFEQNLKTYAALLKKAWETGSVDSNLESEMTNLERKLSDQNDEVRLRVVPRAQRAGSQAHSSAATKHQ